MNLESKATHTSDIEAKIHYLKTGFDKRTCNPDSKKIVRDWVIEISKMVHLGSLVFNKFLLRCLETNTPLPDFSSLTKCQTLFRQCFTILAPSNHTLRVEIHPKLLEVVNEFRNKHKLPNLPRLAGDKSLINY